MIYLGKQFILIWFVAQAEKILGSALDQQEPLSSSSQIF
jgi:hypothetical protein